MFKLYKIPFGWIINTKYVLSLTFNGGFNIGISKPVKGFGKSLNKFRLIHFGWYKN